MKPPIPSKQALITALEPRILLDGAAFFEASQTLSDIDYREKLSSDTEHESTSYSEATSIEKIGPREIVFIEASLPDINELTRHLPENIDLHMIENHENGLERIAAIASEYDALDAIHIIGHGDTARINIGHTTITPENLLLHADNLSSIGKTLSESGDILLYGCNISSDDSGQNLVEKISQITQADIAASSDLTGSKDQLADWDLEHQTGKIEAQTLAFDHYKNTLIDSYTEQQSPTAILTDTTVQASGIYSGGYIEFAIDVPTATETLGFANNLALSSIDGEVTIQSGVVYQGNGSAAVAIGTVDDTFNGENGQPLRVNLAADFSNGGFETASAGDTSIAGWTIKNEQIILGATLIEGQFTPTDPTYPGNNSNQDGGTLNGSTYTTIVHDNTTDGDGGTGNSIRMQSSGTSDIGYSVIRGPYIYSDNAVPLAVGDQVSFDWKAQGGNDAYDVFGYVIDVDSGNTQIILNETGASDSASTSWATSSVTINTAGQYRFVFLSGSYDFTGGMFMGAQLFIDNVAVTQASPPSAVDENTLQQITEAVVYSDTSDLPDNPVQFNKGLTITSVKEDASSTTTNTSFDVIPLNDEPTLSATPDIIQYSTAFTPLDLFSNTSTATIENNQSFTELQIDVNNVSYNTNELLIADGTSIALSDGNSGNTTSGYSYTVAVSGPTATVTLSSNWNDTALNNLVDGLQYQNNSIAANLITGRTVVIASLKDSGGTSDGGDDTAQPLITTTIQRLPVIVALQATYTEGNPPVEVDDDVILQNIPPGTELETATLAITTGLTDGDILSFANDGITMGNIVGSYNSVTGIMTLTSLNDPPTANTPATVTEWENALRAVTYHSTSDYPNQQPGRVVTWTVSEAGVQRFQSDTSIITVLGVNDAPVVQAILPNDVKLLGALHTQNTAPVFVDLENDTLTYSASGMPSGVDIDVNSGLISGNPVELGVFTITVTADDGNSGTASASYILEVIPPNSPSNPGGQTGGESSNSDSSNSSGSDPNPDTGDTGNNNLPESGSPLPDPTSNGDFSIESGNSTGLTGIGTNALPQTAETPADNNDENETLSPVENNTAESASSTPDTTGSTPTTTSQANTSRIAISRFDISIDREGQLQIEEQANADSNTSPSGLTILDVIRENESLVVKVSDIDADKVLSYSATLQNGDPLPSWLSIDSITGEITGNVPFGLDTLDLRIQAINEDGQSRIMELHLVLNEDEEEEELLFPESNDTGQHLPDFSDQLQNAQQQELAAEQRIMDALQNLPDSS